MFKKAIVIIFLLFSSLFSDVSLGVISNHGYIEFDTIDEFSANQGDNWVAVYKKGDSTDWGNVISWSWVRDLPSHGEKTYDFEFNDSTLESGMIYELRFFYDNSFDVVQSVDFTFSGSKPFVNIVSYDSDILSLISSNIDLNTNLWVGVYEKGKSNDWDNVIGWNWVDSTTANDRDYKTTIEGLTLVDGAYDIRLFYNNSFDLEASVRLVVNSSKITRVELDAMIANGEDYSKVDVSGITDMSRLFYHKKVKFDITGWDVSNVTDMSKMFVLAYFNQPIGNWDVSSVTKMDEMFVHSHFNQPIEDWNVSNVTSMKSMFVMTGFNQPIGKWDVSNVTSMCSMFNKTSGFNQPIGDWNVSNVTDMSHMFYKAQKFNQPINNWNVSNVKNYKSFAVQSILQEDYKPHFE